MADPERPKHILRRVRETLGLSREKLASLLGSSAIYIKKIESGEAPMTKRFAMRVAQETGADFYQILDNDIWRAPFDRDGNPITPGTPIDWNGKQLTSESRDAARLHIQKMTEKEVDRYVER